TWAWSTTRPSATPGSAPAAACPWSRCSSSSWRRRPGRAPPPGAEVRRAAPGAPERLVLWDVDGTLVRAGGVAGEVFARAVEHAVGRHPGDHGVSFAGKTDPQIAL